MAIIGDGAMATVCALLLDQRGCRVTIWGAFPEHVASLIQTRNNPHLPGHRLPETIRLASDDHAAFADAQLIVSAVPTQFMRSVWTRLARFVPPAVPIVSVAKGIENGTHQRPSQIIADVLRTSGPDAGHRDRPARPLGALSGPSVAAELARGLPATVCAASDHRDLARFVQATFTTHCLRVYTNDDLLGVELAGATNTVLARGLAEIMRLGVAMGARAATFFGVAGVGDLATTCFAPTGRNRSCGEQLGRGRKLEEVLASMPGVVEGVPTTRSVVALAEEYRVDMPITGAVHDVLFRGLDPIEGISRLMSREPKAELGG